VDAAALARSTPDLPGAAKRAVRSWQERVQQLVQAENITKRSVSRVVSFDHESLALVLMIGVLGSSGPAGLVEAPGGTAGAAGVGGVPGGPAGTASAMAGAGAGDGGGAAGAAAGEAAASGGSATADGTGIGAPAAAVSPDPADAGTGPERLLGSLFGAGQLRELTAKARLDLHERIAALLAPEAARFDTVLDAAGTAQEAVAAQLIEASTALEGAR
jgi:hypothetical protein